MRKYDQIRQSVAYSEKNVKICASHCGLTLGEDGATHQILEDVGMMKMLPNMTVIHTCDFEQTRNATHAVAAHNGPVYFRFGRPKVPIITEHDTPFVIGKARRVMSGSDVTLVANGHLVWNAILAARALAADGISVDLLDMHTIKPLDQAALLESVSRTGCVVSAEEHQRFGGLGESIAACLAAHNPTELARQWTHTPRHGPKPRGAGRPPWRRRVRVLLPHGGVPRRRDPGPIAPRPIVVPANRRQPHWRCDQA